MISLEAQNLSGEELYKLMIGAVVPRPIAWVSTLNLDESVNLAPFSYFNAVSSEPPCLSISINAKNDEGPFVAPITAKDTLKNIERTGEFVVNFSTAPLASLINQSAAPYDYGVSELKTLNLTPLPSLKIKPPRVKESPLHFECVTHQIIPIHALNGSEETAKTHLVIGRIVQFHILEEAYKNGRIDSLKLEPLFRMGGPNYGVVKEQFALPRAKVTS